MSSSPDLSKIIELIMQNPSIISEIQGLIKSDEEKRIDEPKNEEQKREEQKPKMPVMAEPEVQRGDAEISDISAKARRAKLLSAMKSYVSSERAKAIDSMLAVSEILDVMKVGK